MASELAVRYVVVVSRPFFCFFKSSVYTQIQHEQIRENVLQYVEYGTKENA